MALFSGELTALEIQSPSSCGLFFTGQLGASSGGPGACPQIAPQGISQSPPSFLIPGDCSPNTGLPSPCIFPWGSPLPTFQACSPPGVLPTPRLPDPWGCLLPSEAALPAWVPSLLPSAGDPPPLGSPAPGAPPPPGLPTIPVGAPSLGHPVPKLQETVPLVLGEIPSLSTRGQGRARDGSMASTTDQGPVCRDTGPQRQWTSSSKERSVL